MNSHVSRFLWLVVVCLGCLAAPAVRAQDYSITTTTTQVTITDNSGNGDTLSLGSVTASSFRFAATGRTFSLNGAAATTTNSSTISLAGITRITVNAGGGNDVIRSLFAELDGVSLVFNGGAGTDEVVVNDLIDYQNLGLTVNAERLTWPVDLAIFTSCDLMLTLEELVVTGVGGSPMISGIASSSLWLSTPGGARDILLGGEDAGSLSLSNAELALFDAFNSVTYGGQARNVVISGGVTNLGLTSKEVIFASPVVMSGVVDFGSAGTFVGTQSLEFQSTVTLTAATELTGSRVVALRAVDLGAHQLTSSVTSGAVSLQGVVSGTGGITANRTVSSSNFVAHTFTGPVVINNSGAFVARHLFSTGTAAGGVTVNAGGGFFADNHATSMEPLTLNGGYLSAANYGGPITLTAASTFQAQSTAGEGITGGISGNFGVTITGAAGQWLTLDRVNGFVGPVSVNGGRLLVNGSTVAGTDYTVGSGAILSGGGTIGGTVTVSSGGTLAPGTLPKGASSSTLSTGSASLSSGSTLAVDLGSSWSHDQVRVTGTVNLGGATLSVGGGFVPLVGTSFLIIRNDGSDAVTGTFNGLDEGSTVTHNGVQLRISYVGGTGNDVTLTPVMPGTLVATFNSATDIPVSADGYIAGTNTVNLALNFAPPIGTTLTVVENLGLDFINGTFTNLPQGGEVTLTFGGVNYHFIANYFGGTGNDLVLLWKGTRVMAWGSNGMFALGTGGGGNSLVPVNVVNTGLLANKTVMAIAAAQQHSLALCTDGTLASWGRDLLEGLGNGDNGSSGSPAAVDQTGVLSGKTVVALSSPFFHSLVLCSDGTVAAWGAGGSGQLGNGGNSDGAVPVLVNTAGVLAGKVVVAVAAGASHSLALCSDGTVVAWGYNDDGQLGNGSNTASNVPVLVNLSGVLAGKTVISIAAGYYHSLALCSDGTVAAWGGNTAGQLGNNSNTDSNVPVLVTLSGVLAGKSVLRIGAGVYHSLVLCSDGTVAAWGDGTNGQLGNSNNFSSNVPVLVTTTGALSGKTVSAISAGFYHSQALCTDGTLTAWGSNEIGRLGDNSTTHRNAPVVVSRTNLDAGDVFLRSVGGDPHSLALVAGPPVVPNAVPTDIALTSSSLAENAGANAVVGTLSSTDADAGDTHTYSLVTGAGDTNNAAFNISGNSLRLTASADFETLSSYSVLVQTNDGNGGTYAEAFTITITNVNELPSFTKGADQTHVSGTNTAQSISNWATAINDGDSTVEQTLSFNVSNNNNAIFTTQPTISSNGTLTYTPNGTAGTATVSVSITDDNTINGNAALTSAVQTFTITVAPVADYSVVVTATNITVTDLSGNGNSLTLQQQSGDTIRFFDVGRTFSVNGGLPNTTRPASDISLVGITSITVHAGEGDDLIGVQAFTTAMPSLTINGGNGSDSLSASGDVTFVANASVAFDGGDESNTLSTAGNITFQSGAEWVLSGTGSATLRCGRAFSMSSGARLVAVNGDVLVEANQQATPREGSFAGITLTGNATANSVVLGTSGTGNVTLRGRSAELAGISCTSGASIMGGTAGTVTVIGECRSTLANGSHGITFQTSSLVSTSGASIVINGTSGLGGGNFGTGASITQSSVTTGGTGTISITGTGRGTAGSVRRGVEIGTSNVLAAMALVSTTAGDITIQGNSGDGASGSNYGVQVYFANVQAGGGGNVSVTGTSNGTVGNFNSGITMSSSPTITATGTGDVSLNGTSGTSPGDGMIGVVLPTTSGTPISTQNGDIAITSTNRGTGAGVSSDHALNVAAGVNVTTTGSGSITLTGMASSVQAWDGVRIVGRVTTGGGSVTLNGTGGGMGIQIVGGVVEGPAAGSTLTVNGTGGSVATNYTHGFQTSSSAQLTTTGGNVVFRCFGGTGGTLESAGINLFGSGLISAGGDGTITLEGTAGSGVGQTTIPLIGTWLRSGGVVQTSNGSITIKGTTNNLSSNVNCAGINGSSGSAVTAGGVGNIDLQANSMIFAGSMTATGDTIRARPLTAGTTMKLGAADNRGSAPLVLGLTDAELDTLSAAILKLGDATTGGVSIDAAISLAASTNLELDGGTGGMVFNTGGINSGGGTVLLKSTLGTQPISSGTDVTASTVTEQSGLTFDIGGTTVDTQYRQLKAVGAVTLTGSALTLTGAYVPAAGNSFTLIDNDGTDAVMGTFTGLVEGATLTFNGIPLRLSYVGGTGNDVVLTLLNQAPTAIALSNSSVAENGAANALIGTLSSTDANNADTHTYSLVSGAGSTHNAAFDLTGNELRLIASADFETLSSYSVRIRSTDNGTPALSVEQALTITVINVNEMPSFTAGGNQLHVFGTSVAQSITGWATGINDGDSTVTQTLSFTVSNNNNGLFTAPPAVAANGTLTYTPNGTAGSATVSVSLTDDASINGNAALTTGMQTFLITIGENAAPTISAIAAQGTLEDTTSSAIAFTVGDSEQSLTSLTVTAASTNTTLIPVANVALVGTGANRTATITPVANFSGTSQITLTVSDGLLTAERTFTFTVTAVNDLPSFAKGANQTHLFGTNTAQSVESWATAINDGDSVEEQTLSFNVTNNNNSLFTTQPTISSTGTLTYTPRGTAGTATVSVSITDDNTIGGNAALTSAVQTFTITVGANTAPTISAITAQSTLEDTVSGAISFTVGDAETATADLLVTAASSNATLIPVVNIAHGGIGASRNVVITPVTDLNGTSNITLTVSDGTTTASSVFALTVTPVNDAPSFTPGIDETRTETIAATAYTVSNWATALTKGPANESAQTLQFVITGNSNAGLFTVAPAISSTGALTYTVAGLAYGTAAITYKLHDSGGTDNGGVNESKGFTLNITVGEVNHPPSVIGSGVPNQTLGNGTAPLNLDLFSYFTDLDVQDALGFSIVTNTAPDRATAAIVGSTLTLTPVSTGVTSITVRCIDDGEPARSVEQTFTITVGSATLSLVVDSNARLNRTTGLLESRVRITNTLGRVVEGFRIQVTNLPAKYQLWNRTHATLPVIELNQSLPSGGVVTVLLEFYSPTRSFGSYRPAFTVVEIAGNKPLEGTGGTPALRTLVLPDSSVLVQFAAVISRSYVVEYSDDRGRSWRISPVGVRAGATRIQWVDQGPPYTHLAPVLPLVRQYRMRTTN